jgi:hypothetical protein
MGDAHLRLKAKALAEDIARRIASRLSVATDLRKAHELAQWRGGAWVLRSADLRSAEDPPPPQHADADEVFLFLGFFFFANR